MGAADWSMAISMPSRRSSTTFDVTRTVASSLVSLLALQIFLGAQIIWTQRTAAMTTGHVLVGALTLATTFWLTWVAHRDAIEGHATA